MKDEAIWTAFRTVDYGYTRMTIHNKTHISIEQVSVDNVSVTKYNGYGILFLFGKEHSHVLQYMVGFFSKNERFRHNQSS